MLFYQSSEQFSISSLKASHSFFAEDFVWPVITKWLPGLPLGVAVHLQVRSLIQDDRPTNRIHKLIVKNVFIGV